MPDAEETEMPTRSFQEELETARAQPPAQRPRLVAASADAAPEDAPTPTPLRSFADELESAQLARERPLPPNEIERLRRR
jgi:hypothetical protein